MCGLCVEQRHPPPSRSHGPDRAVLQCDRDCDRLCRNRPGWGDSTGTPWPSPRFTVDGDCVRDNVTGLTWVRVPDATERTWQQAPDHANGLTLCSQDDWRLPNVNELESLLHSGQLNTAAWLNGQGFSNLQSDDYWTSDTWAKDLTLAWTVDLWFSTVSGDWKSATAFTLPVRGGTIGPSPQQFTLTIAGAGSGSGTVTLSGINCTINGGTTAGDCTETYDSGASVTLTAPAANPDSVFTSGVAIGTVRTGHHGCLEDLHSQFQPQCDTLI